MFRPSPHILLLLFFLIIPLVNTAHPTGNMVVSGEYVLWSYIDPIDDTNHYACVMAWKPGSEPEVVLRSEYPASDFMIYAQGEVIWLIQRKFMQQNQANDIRLLRMQIGGTPEVVLDWQKDNWRLGEGGFFVDADGAVIFCSYPGIYRLTREGTAEKLFEFENSLRRLRKLDGDRLLLLGESRVWMTDLQGNILRHWDRLTQESVEDAPLNRNMIFDMDYKDGRLLLAYWGARRFDIVDENGSKETILLQRNPLAPHWVAFYRDNLLLFSSRLIMDGSTPKPHLTRVVTGGRQEVIWD